MKQLKKWFQDVRHQWFRLIWSGKKRRRSFVFIWLLVFLLAVFSYLTNPFVRFSIVNDPYQEILLSNNQLQLENTGKVVLHDNIVTNTLAELKSTWHIVSSRFTGGPQSKSVNVAEIIAEIHKLRFSPDVPYLISGDHFSVLYPRSLGIFYHSALDPRTALDAQDWENRQRIYLKTTAYALQVYSQTDHLSTTIVPISPHSVALLNIYSYPSDTLYSLLYALQVMKDPTTIEKLYPYTTVEKAPSLQTSSASAQLVVQYKESLRRHLEKYNADFIDPATGLVRTNLLLSGTKDITKRQGAFYDNVILWRTNQLAQELEIVPVDAPKLDALREKILQTYWLDKEGHFLEDLSPEGVKGSYYSSDWLVALMTGFLDPGKEADRPYLLRSVEYIQKNAIDQPFGLQYHPDLRAERQYFPVNLLAPSYGSTAIWSNWGQEYIKLLVRLGIETKNTEYQTQAEQQVAAYTYNIKRYRGYPELYNSNGDFYRQLFYKSVRQTGWVVSYEQARAMTQWGRQQLTQLTRGR